MRSSIFTAVFSLISSCGGRAKIPEAPRLVGQQVEFANKAFEPVRVLAASTIQAMATVRRVRATKLLREISEGGRYLGAQTLAHVTVELGDHDVESVLEVGEHGLEITMPPALTTARAHADMKAISEISGGVTVPEKKKDEVAEEIEIHGQPALPHSLLRKP